MTTRGMAVQVAEITGGPVLVAKLQLLEGKIQRKIVRTAIAAGNKILIQAARRAVPSAKTPGHTNRSLVKSIKGRIGRNRLKGVTEAKVGIGVGRRPSKAVQEKRKAAGKAAYFNAPHAHLFALGTTGRWTGGKTDRKTGKRVENGKAIRWRGKMPANPFFQNATQARSSEALSTMKRVFLEELQKYIP
jgi:HK97 gp10 family phage protein